MTFRSKFAHRLMGGRGNKRRDNNYLRNDHRAWRVEEAAPPQMDQTC